jgi:hypothetical protein
VTLSNAMQWKVKSSAVTRCISRCCAVSPVVCFDAPVNERVKENHMMLKAQLGLIGRPCLGHIIQLSKGHTSNSRVG